MNRLILVAATVVAFTLPSVAAADTAVNVDSSQTAGTWVNGLKLGLTYSTLNGDVQDNVAVHTGTTLGYFFSYRLGNGLAIQPEIAVVDRGAENAITNESGRDADLSYSYLDIPVLARYNYSLGHGITPYAYGGPSLSINIDSSRRVSTNAIDYDGQTTNFDFGFATGFGVDYLIGNNVGATIDARFSMGFLSTDDTDADRSLKNQAFLVMLGIWK